MKTERYQPLISMTVYSVPLIILCSLFLPACKKDFLDKKPYKALLVPTTLADFDALLDNNNNVFNIGPGLNEIASGDLYITNDGYISLVTPEEQNTYIFADDIYAGQQFISEWNTPYMQVFYANVVLDGLKQLNPDINQTDYNRIKGTALFDRAFAFYNLVQLFSKPYNKNTASTDLGVPLRLSSDVNLKSVRSTVADTYKQIFSDLNASKSLLPETAKFKTRPSRAAVDGLLSRVYLSIGDYPDAKLSADSCLAQYNKLYDYNTLDSTSYSPFPQVLPDNGDEVIFYSRSPGYSFELNSNTFIDSTLYQTYAANDLRRAIFFANNGTGMYNYKGTYEGNYYFFGGLATDEIYFNRAECYARSGNVDLAMQDLNTVLKQRWKTGTYENFKASNVDNALRVILQERRKELIGRGLRWSDLRRLNTDPRFAVTITHVINGKTHLLLPGDKHYVFPIPEYEIQTSGIQQN